MAIKNYGVVNTKHKYGYGYKPKYASVSEMINDTVNVITERQWVVINDIESCLGYKFSGTKQQASQFIDDHLEELRAYRKRLLIYISPADEKLFKRGVSREDIALIRQIEEVTGLDFSQYRQVRMEAMRFIEENRGCLV